MPQVNQIKSNQIKFIKQQYHMVTNKCESVGDSASSYHEMVTSRALYISHESYRNTISKTMLVKTL